MTNTNNNEPSTSRRRFVIQLSVIGVAVAAVPVITLLKGASAAGSMTAVGKIGDFTKGDFKKVATASGDIYVGRTAGGFIAFSSRCTHRGCEVLWNPKHKLFRCPCHGGMFDAAGKNVAGPPPSPLPSISTKVEGGVVYVAA